VLAAGVVAPSRRGRAIEFAPAALLAAVGFGVIAQGGCYPFQLAILASLVAVAALTAGLSGVRHPAVLGAAGLAAAALLSGLVAGDPGGSGRTVALRATGLSPQNGVNGRGLRVYGPGLCASPSAS